MLKLENEEHLKVFVNDVIGEYSKYYLTKKLRWRVLEVFIELTIIFVILKFIIFEERKSVIFFVLLIFILIRQFIAIMRTKIISLPKNKEIKEEINEYPNSIFKAFKRIEISIREKMKSKYKIENKRTLINLQKMLDRDVKKYGETKYIKTTSSNIKLVNKIITFIIKYGIFPFPIIKIIEANNIIISICTIWITFSILSILDLRNKELTKQTSEIKDMLLYLEEKN